MSELSVRSKAKNGVSYICPVSKIELEYKSRKYYLDDILSKGYLMDKYYEKIVVDIINYEVNIIEIFSSADDSNVSSSYRVKQDRPFNRGEGAEYFHNINIFEHLIDYIRNTGNECVFEFSNKFISNNSVDFEEKIKFSISEYIAQYNEKKFWDIYGDGTYDLLENERYRIRVYYLDGRENLELSGKFKLDDLPYNYCEVMDIISFIDYSMINKEFSDLSLFKFND